MGRGDFTLGDLLSETSLELELLCGADDALRSPIAGAHAIELDNPAKWLDSGWMMLTMGVRLRNQPQLQRALIAELDSLGATCLGFGVGLVFKSVPAALLDEARRRNFPVLLVPEDTQFRSITRAVFQSTLGVESTTFQRLSAIQQNLVLAFGEENPLESIVQRLGRLVNSTVAVLSIDGKVDAATGALPITKIVSELRREQSPLTVQFVVDDWQVLAAPMTASYGGNARWLAVASRRTSVSEALARAAVQVAVPLIDALLRLSVTRQGQDRAIQQSLLNSVLDEGPGAIDLRMMEARIGALGIDFDGAHRTVVVRSREDAPATSNGRALLDSVAAWMHSRLDCVGVRYLLSRRPMRPADEIVVVAPAGRVLDGVFNECVNRWPDLIVGIGRAVGTLMDIRSSHRDGQIVARHLAVRARERVMSFDELDVVTQLLAEVPTERLSPKVAQIAALLTANPIQLEALRAFFANDRDIKAAADSIFVHPNTLRYRLERLEHSLGGSLRDPSVTASLYCVLALMSDVAPDAPAAKGAPTADLIQFPPPTALHAS